MLDIKKKYDDDYVDDEKLDGMCIKCIKEYKIIIRVVRSEHNFQEKSSSPYQKNSMT